MKEIAEVELYPYYAKADGAESMELGTVGSYGIKKLRISPKSAWDGLVISATFVTASGRVRVVVPESGVIDVPQEATAATSGKIVFAGVADGVQRITVDLPYTVRDHSPVDGTDPQPTPDEFAQLTAEYQNRLDKAVPPDGEPGQVLTKTADGNAWQAPQGGGGGAGQDGGYYTPSIQQTTDSTAQFSWTASDDAMPPVEPVTLTLPQGPQGEPGQNGADGKDGQQGPQGEPGRDGQDGAPGADGITPNIGENGNWYIGDVDTGKPSRGEQGPAGQDGAQGLQGIPGADGAAAGFGQPTATVDDTTGTPSVQITASGPDTAKVFNFAFSGLKGEPGQDAEALEPLIGTTETVTPAQVIEAVQQGRQVVITYFLESLGSSIVFTSFNCGSNYFTVATYIEGTIMFSLFGTTDDNLWNSKQVSIPSIPTVTASDAGKFLRVDSNGTWAAESVPSAEGVSF